MLVMINSANEIGVRLKVASSNLRSRQDLRIIAIKSVHSRLKIINQLLSAANTAAN